MRPIMQKMAEMQMTEQLSPSPVDDVRTRVPPPRETTCWQDFMHSVSNFCGLVDEEQEASNKWQARLEDIEKDRVIGHGKPTPSVDETDAAPLIRYSSRTPILLTTASRRSRRAALRESTQSGFFSTVIDGCSDLVAKPKKSKRKPQVHSRSFTPASIREYGQSSDFEYRDEDVDIDNVRFANVADIQRRLDSSNTLNDYFFSEPVGTSLLYRRSRKAGGGDNQQERTPSMHSAGDSDEVDFGRSRQKWLEQGKWLVRSDRDKGHRIDQEPLGFEAGFERGIDLPRKSYDEYDYGPEDLRNPQLDEVDDNANRHRVNQSWFGRLLDQGIFARIFNFKLVGLSQTHKHRPLFSMWMTFVQILICIVSLAVYGIAPWGIDETIISKEIIQPNLAYKLESYREKDNLWVGPRQADLIKLGAKFSPCMRRDTNVYQAITNDRVEENKTACCIYNDGSGCVQTKETECSDVLATWNKWTKDKPGQSDFPRTSGSVCGQDPKTCIKPLSLHPFAWPDDITRWPVCEETLNVTGGEANRHLTCEVVGRPCCKGIQGECVITTRQHCDFYRGHFHEEATLCSQVNCMADICAMLPFGNPEYPDQFYRLWTCLFLHAGFLHLLVTVLFNLLVMVSMEQAIGWIRITVIYMGSGVCGSLASAIFVPYHVEAGASGSQFGLLATQLVLVVLYTKESWKAAWKILVLILVLLVIGLLPIIDNYAHLFGFLFGLLFSFAILPFARFKGLNTSVRTQRLAAIITCSILALGLAVVLFILFYVAPIYNCPGCHFFNCIPFTSTFCDTMEVKVRDVSGS